MLELIDLSRRFNDVHAVEGLGFAIPEGELVGFVGRNGAGKTTTMRIITGVLSADSGEVRWRGEPLGASSRRQIGYMPEERGLYPKMRVGEQLEYLAMLHGQSASDARQATRRWCERLGVDERIGDRVEALSHGNQQRVQLAAALVHDPDILVLDEPFAGLDPIGADVMAEVLSERARAGVAVLFSSHDLDLVERLCGSVVIIDGGRLVASGPIEELRGARSTPLLRVEVRGATEDWSASLDGVRVVERDGNLTLLALDGGAEPQGVLDAARRAGAVTHFSEVVPSLSRLFREAIER